MESLVNFVTPRNSYDPRMNGGICSFNIVNNQVEFESACPAGFTGVFGVSLILEHVLALVPLESLVKIMKSLHVIHIIRV